MKSRRPVFPVSYRSDGRKTMKYSPNFGNEPVELIVLSDDEESSEGSTIHQASIDAGAQPINVQSSALSLNNIVLNAACSLNSTVDISVHQTTIHGSTSKLVMCGAPVADIDGASSSAALSMTTEELTFHAPSRGLIRDVAHTSTQTPHTFYNVKTFADASTQTTSEPDCLLVEIKKENDILRNAVNRLNHRIGDEIIADDDSELSDGSIMMSPIPTHDQFVDNQFAKEFIYMTNVSVTSVIDRNVSYNTKYILYRLPVTGRSHVRGK